MRWWSIALAIFILNFSLTLVGSLTDVDGNPLFPGVSSYQVIKNSEWGKDKYQEVAKELNPQKSGLAKLISEIGALLVFIVNGFGIVINVILNATLRFPTMLHSEPFNFPSFITDTIGIIQSLVYAAGAIQFLTGRNM